jgi:hypothetical protein
MWLFWCDDCFNNLVRLTFWEFFSQIWRKKPSKFLVGNGSPNGPACTGYFKIRLKIKCKCNSDIQIAITIHEFSHILGILERDVESLMISRSVGQSWMFGAFRNHVSAITFNDFPAFETFVLPVTVTGHPDFAASWTDSVPIRCIFLHLQTVS